MIFSPPSLLEDDRRQGVEIKMNRYGRLVPTTLKTIASLAAQW
jgi:hypothetical protein